MECRDSSKERKFEKPDVTEFSVSISIKCVRDQNAFQALHVAVYFSKTVRNIPCIADSKPNVIKQINLDLSQAYDLLEESPMPIFFKFACARFVMEKFERC